MRAVRSQLGLVVAMSIATVAHSADLVLAPSMDGLTAGEVETHRGRVTVLDGRTVTFFPNGPTVRLADVDVCNLPQWAFERSGYPYPCGPLAKAWLKRLVRHDPVSCRTQGQDRDGVVLARCTVRGGDLGYNVVRAGIGQTPKGQVPPDGCYGCAEEQALRNGWGLNGTVYLDPLDWRRRADDRSLDRLPFRDRNMIRDELGTVYVPAPPRNPAAD